MVRVILLVVWLFCSAWLAIWVGEALFSHDQTRSILPFAGDDAFGATIVVGVGWGIIMTFGGVFSLGTPPARKLGRTGLVGVGTVVETRATGLTVNDVPQYDIFVRIAPRDGTPFIGRLRMLVRSAEQEILRDGLPLAVRYRPGRDDVALADTAAADVRDALLDWRIAHGLLDPRLVPARKNGVVVPAHVLEVRPTGIVREGQSELRLRVLVSPEAQRPWEAETSVFAYPEAMPRLQLGSPVWARYLREDPRLVAITIEKEQ